MSEHLTRICFVGRFDPKLCDGVSRSMFDLFLFLREQGCRPSILSFMDDNFLCWDRLHHLIHLSGSEIFSAGEDYCEASFRGLDIYYKILKCDQRQAQSAHPEVMKHVMTKLDEFRDAYIFTCDGEITGLIAKSISGARGAHYFHSPIYISLYQGNTKYRTILEQRTVFAGSRFSQAELKKSTGIDAVIWPPFINFEEVQSRKSEDKGRVIGYYSAGWHKGDEIINKLVNTMADCQFIAMGRYDHDASEKLPGNLEIWRNVTDTRLFYEKIKIMLVPSIGMEGFSRVIIEAAANGIPTIANRVGGIDEALGESGIIIDIDKKEKVDADELTRQYTLAIKKLLGNEEIYRDYSQKALRRAEKFQQEQYRISHSLYKTHVLMGS